MKSKLRVLQSATAIIAVIGAALLSGCVRCQLFSDSLIEPPGTRAKPIEVYYREIERNNGYSITEYKIVSGPSVPVIIFGVRGNCTIARRENWSYFGSEKLDGVSLGWSRHRLFEVETAKGQTEKNEEERSKFFSTSDCTLLFR
ncbi:MAG: hypothetical protein EAZ21_07755 [Betaproteobacteria bacterium]|nr:MAG: hypothetical protein EAZ21_07755 [Betaproteobacteria bacterium]